ncbi:endonuclease/exonuclease/phosphatase family metal-dependent hydrolase [Allocatelliglobosispora scoriae]|uniref:Endonuclease/exonuclease/phosphatase family metal-dependent hydrolase n=1 Tax=Allocatelliglobosispora scoriae TaxID=643052 RepID=A0A841C315_9ACTN|nr:endonuclease/exonuclease/phosphatase family protein [Allocatelliglobosispora scoriae]MBB5874158.1 endonuclease/exonuclease/phosphatase family metal-dependent hydrolase [Allocatelliglobosispora scoriae]
MRRILALALAALPVLLLAQPAHSAPDGTLTPTSATVLVGDAIGFSYTTPLPNAKNWVGLYSDPGNGPVNEQYVGPSTKWVYTAAASGTGSLPSAGLTAGRYILYFLRDDGYAWAAPPVTVQLVATTQPRFVSTAFDLRNAKVGTAYSATVGGLVVGNTTGLTFRKTSGPAWVAVAANGTVSGTPTATGIAPVGIRATNASGLTADTVARVEVQASVLVPTLKVLSWNLWHGGTQVGGYREKQLRFLLEQDVDAVGIQENEGSAAQQLAQALGWSYHQNSDIAVLSRYPITATGPVVAGSAIAATINLGSRSVKLWSAHLGYTPYGPYDACFGRMSTSQLLNREAQSGRTQQITSIITAMQADLTASSSVPVLLVGDFNAPSHLDWTGGNSRCGYGAVAWPTSTAPQNAGLTDSFRQANPNPATAPGNTWSPVFKTYTGGYGYDSHAGEPEPQDRIDFIHYRGPLAVQASQTVVEGTPSQTNPGSNAWTSDHAAVLTTFRVS